MKSATIAAVQMRALLGDVPRNVECIAAWVNRAVAAKANLVFFPECSLTGYNASRSAAASIDAADENVTLLERFARDLGITIGFGFIERHDGCSKPFDTYVVTNGFERLVYRKTHLGTSEASAFEPGDDLPVMSIGGIKMGVQLCWEAHMPDITQTLRSRGAELVLIPHAVPVGGQRRLTLWERYLPARALDNGLFVAACNALSENSESPGGGIAVYGPDGSLLASCTSSEPEMVLAEIGGALPRETPDDGMRAISYFDRRKPELYRE